MKNIFVLIISFWFTHNVNAQASVKDSDIFLYNRVYKNIAAFNIKFASHTFNGAIDDSPFYSTTNFFYEDFLPDFNAKMMFEINKLAIKYPVKGYDIYEIVLNGMKFKHEKYTSVIEGMHPGKYFLIAVDKNYENIKFISGQFFISAVSADFALNLKEPSSLIEYLTFKTYNQQLQSINYKKRSGNKFYYTAFSALIQKPVEVILDTKKIEYPEMKLIK